MKCAVGHCGHCQLGPALRLQGRARCSPVDDRAAASTCGRSDERTREPEARRLEVRLLRRLPAQPARLRGRAARARRRGRDRLLPRGAARRPSRAPTTSRWSRARSPRRTMPSASTRCGALSRRLVTIGACATAGGIQALRNFADVEEFISVVYATPEYISTLATSTPIGDHVPVDFELRGCPINKRQLLEVISAFLDERAPGDRQPQRLHRVQAARQRLRDGRPRHALPRPGDARRLRRALPATTAAATAASARWRRRTRRSLAGWLRDGLGIGRASTWSASSGTLQRRRASRSGARARRWRPMSGTSATAHDPHRRPGPGRGRGRAVRAGPRRRGRWTSSCRSSSRRASSRRFCAAAHSREAPDITARICGICPVAYQMSACQAMEDASASRSTGRSGPCAG